MPTTLDPDELGPYWHEDTISEMHIPISEVIYEGSDDEHYTSPAARRRAYVAAGYCYLQARPPAILSARIQGPFDATSGWKNPWLPQIPTSLQAPSHESSGSMKVAHRSSSSGSSRILKSGTSKPQESQESHLPSPESLKHASAASTPHRSMDKEDFHFLNRWRDGFKPDVHKDYGTKPAVSLSSLKRKSGILGTKTVSGKRQKTQEDGQRSSKRIMNHTGRFSLSQPPRRGFRSLVDDPLKISFSNPAGKLESYSTPSTNRCEDWRSAVNRSNHNAPGEECNGKSFRSLSKRLSQSRRSLEGESDDELAQENNITLNSPNSSTSEESVSDEEQTTILASNEVADSHLDVSIPSSNAVRDQHTSRGNDEVTNNTTTSPCKVLALLKSEAITSRKHVSARGLDDIPMVHGCRKGSLSSMSHFKAADDVRMEELGCSVSLDMPTVDMDNHESLPERHSLNVCMSLDPEERPDENVDAMLLDQLTQTSCHRGQGSQEMALDEDMSTDDTEMLDVGLKDAPLTELQSPGVTANQAQSIDVDNTGTSGLMSAGPGVTYAKRHSGATTSPPVVDGSAHFSFSALVSKLVPVKPWSSFGSFRRGIEASGSTEGESIIEDAPTPKIVGPDHSMQPDALVQATAQHTEDDAKVEPTDERNEALMDEKISLLPGPPRDVRECVHVDQCHVSLSTWAAEGPGVSPARSEEISDVSMASIRGSDSGGCEESREGFVKVAELPELAQSKDKFSSVTAQQKPDVLPSIRCKTPEPRFSIKSMASFMSPSPQRQRPHSSLTAPAHAGWVDKLKPALKSSLPCSSGKKRVTWAPLLDEVEFYGSERLRPVSPPPENAKNMESGKESKFQQHFTAVTRRLNGRDLLLRSQPAHHLCIAPNQKTTVMLLAKEEKTPDTFGEAVTAPSPTCQHEKGISVECETTEEPEDIVEDVFKEMTELLQTWDVDIELDMARRHSTAVVPPT